VSGLTGVKAIAGGGWSGYALKSDGIVWAWGDNEMGQLGNGSVTDSHVPVQVSALIGCTGIAAGSMAAYALKRDGTVWAWGAGNGGALGNSSKTNIDRLPVEVSGLTDVTAIAAAAGTGYALKRDGTAWAWGDNEFGQLGNDSYALLTDAPVEVSGLTGVSAISGGWGSGYALKADGTVWAWGTNDFGELGNGSTVRSSVPVQVSGLSGVEAVAAGSMARLRPETGWDGMGLGIQEGRPVG